jgi:hypothetical protein
MWRYKKGMPEKCLETTSLMKELGFMINVEKSVLVPQYLKSFQEHHAKYLSFGYKYL